MKTPPYAAALTAVLITLAGGPVGLGQAHARAIYTGTFDPQDNDYEWKGTHVFSISDACLSSGSGWRAANTGTGGNTFALQVDGYTNLANGYVVGESPYACDAKLEGGSLELRRKSGPDQTFKKLTFGPQPAAVVWGVFIKDGELAGVDTFLTGPFRFSPADEQVLFNQQVFEDGGVSLRWESGRAPLNYVPTTLFDDVNNTVSQPAYLQSLVDPVYLYKSVGSSDNYQEVTPGVSAPVVTFNRTDRIPGVPEPGSITLVGAALLALGGLSARRLRKG